MLVPRLFFRWEGGGARVKKTHQRHLTSLLTLLMLKGKLRYERCPVALGWGMISTGGHPDNNIAPAMKAARNGELVAVYSRDQGRGDAFAENPGAEAAYD